MPYAAATSQYLRVRAAAAGAVWPACRYALPPAPRAGDLQDGDCVTLWLQTSQRPVVKRKGWGKKKKKEGLGLPTQVPRGGGQMHGTGEQLQRGQTGAQAASAGSEAGSAPWRADPSPWRSGSSEPPSRREDPRSLPRSLHRRVASSLVGWAKWQDQWEVSKAQMGRLGQE